MTGHHPMQAPPRELSAEEAQQRAEQMFALEQTMKQAVSEGRSAMWQFAAAAHAFDEEAGWSALGYDTPSEWLAQPELGMSRSHFYRLVRVYRELALRKIDATVLPQLEPTKVDIVLGRVKSGEVQIEDALEDVRELGQRDLREKYYDRPDPAASVPSKAQMAEAEEADVLEAADLTAEDEGWSGFEQEETEGAQNPPSVSSGHLVIDEGLGQGTLHVLGRIWQEVAPKEKRRMTGELREEIRVTLLRWEEAMGS